MADNTGPEDWELRSFSSDKLKKSSSVEILLGTYPTRGRLLATSPTSSISRVTTHKMKGSGRPTNNKASTRPPSAVPPSSALPSVTVRNGGVAKDEAKDLTETPHTVADTKKNTAVNTEPTGSKKSLRQACDNPPPPDILTPSLTPTPVTQTSPASPIPAIHTPVSPTTLTLKPVPYTPLTFTPLTSTSLTTPVTSIPATSTPAAPAPATSTPAAPAPATSTPSEAAVPPSSVHKNIPHTSPTSKYKNLKEKGSHLAPLVTTPKPEYQSPIGTPRGTPKGTPIIGKRGHVFSVSTPDVEPSTGQPVPLCPLEIARAKRPSADSAVDPFELRRKIKPVAEAEMREEGGVAEGDGEHVWQRRLSLLFVPPTEDELEPDKESEETTRLLPLTTTANLLRRQSAGSIPSPPISRRKDRDERANRKERKPTTKNTGKASERRNEEDKPRESRITIREERSVREEERQRKGREKRKTKFSRFRRSSISDDSTSSSSSSSIASSDDEKEERQEEEEEEEEEEGRDDYISWDDTICSNRSAYFKKYYSQRGVIGRPYEDKENSFKSPFEASHNSLSSLIRERMGKTAPNGKKNIQVGLVVLVVVLLTVIVVGISLTSYFYHLHLLELSIFNRIKFYEKPRLLEVYDPTWKPVITLQMGTNLPLYSIPEDCTHYLRYLQSKNSSLPHHGLDDDHYEEMTCLDWTGLAQLHLRKLSSAGSVQCYSVWWVALNSHITLRDCLRPISIDEERSFTWWGGGEMASGGYPVTRADIPPTTMDTGKLARDPWGQLLRRTWLSNSAALLILPARFRGQVSVNYQQDRQVCLEVPVTPCATYDPNLSYTLCTAPNLTILTDYLHQRAVHARHDIDLAAPSFVNYTVEEPQQDNNDTNTHEFKVMRETFAEEVVTRVEERLESPVWIPWMTPDSPYLTQEAVLRYVDRVETNATGMLGHVLLPASWQTRPGEMEFDPDRFPDPVALSDTLKAKGFRLALTLHPFISVDAPDFKKGTAEGLWVRQKDSLMPALAHYDEQHPTVVIDFTNPRTRQWYSSKLDQLREKYGVDRFHLQPADAHALPTYRDFHRPVHSSDDTIMYFMASVSSVSAAVSTGGAIMPPLPPTFVTLGTGDGSWEEMETLVPRVLTLSMLGFPFIDVGPIGGLARAGHVPDRELYMRWIEVSAFLPAMQVSVLPSIYGEEVENLTREYLAIRRELVLPRLLDKVQDALDNSTPLITPLALFLPDDPEAAKVDDQWMVGDDLLVAPVTRRGARTRTLYLPKGIWKDCIDGNLRNGGRWVKDYEVPLSKTPHFLLKYVNDFDT